MYVMYVSFIWLLFLPVYVKHLYCDKYIIVKQTNWLFKVNDNDFKGNEPDTPLFMVSQVGNKQNTILWLIVSHNIIVYELKFEMMIQ